MGDRLATIDMGRKLGGYVPFGRGAGSPGNTMRPGRRPTFVPCGILIHPALSPQQTWVEIWGLCPLLGEGSWVPIRGSWVPIQHNAAGAEAYLRTKWHLDASSTLATIDPSNRLATIHQRYRSTEDRIHRQRSDSIGQTV